jgi:hypothetical protein
VRGTGDTAFLADFPLDSTGAIDDTFTELSSATVREDLATIMVAEKKIESRHLIRVRGGFFCLFVSIVLT